MGYFTTIIVLIFFSGFTVIAIVSLNFKQIRSFTGSGGYFLIISIFMFSVFVLLQLFHCTETLLAFTARKSCTFDMFVLFVIL